MLNLNNIMGNKGEDTKGNAGKTGTATVGQIQFYKDLCNQKSVDVDPNHTSWTVTQMSSKINELLEIKKVPNATNKQVETIISLSKQLNLPEPRHEAVEKLNVKQASETIEKLIQKLKTDDKPSEKQLEMLADMFKCPDVIITDLIPIHPTLIRELDELTVLHKKALNNKTKATTYNNEKITLKEIQDEIVKTKKHIEKTIVNFDLSQLTKKEVSDFIQDNSEKFYAWRDDTPSQAQKDFIRTLQERLSKIESWAINMDEIQCDINGSPSYDVVTPVKDELILTGEHLLTDDELNLFSKKQASQLIDMLQKELRNAENYSRQEEELDDAIGRNILDLTKANEKEIEKLEGMIHSLYALIGQEVEEGFLEQSNISESLKDLIEFCNLYTDTQAIKSLIDEFTSSDVLFQNLGIELE